MSSPYVDRISTRGDFLQVQLGFQGMQHTVVDFALTVHLQKLCTAGFDGGQHGRVMVDAVRR